MEPGGALAHDAFEDPPRLHEDGTEADLRHRTGSLLPVAVSSRTVPGRKGVISYALTNLSRLRRAEEEIAMLRFRDPRTGLLNASGVADTLDRRLAACRRNRQPTTLLCFELPNLPSLRRMHGSEVGMALLARAGERLAALLGADDALGRLGDDRFALIHCGDGGQALLAAIAASFDEPVEAGEVAAILEIAAGCATYPRDATDAAALLAAAETALIVATERGIAFQVFDESSHVAVGNRRALIRDLMRAVEHDQLWLVYQPQVYIATGEPFGFEALLRWTHPTRGPIAPDFFIPLAEKSGAIRPIGDWVLSRACSEASSWTPPLSISVNVSVMQLLAPTFALTVRETLRATGLAPERLELEITETAVAAHGQRALEALRELKLVGVRLSLDDFGAGFSSFGALRAFRFDRIKMDRSLVQNADRDKRSAALVRAIAAMTRSLGVSLVAEGIETMGECAFLRSERLVEGQGYLFGRPCAQPDFRERAPMPLTAGTVERRRQRALV